MKRLAILTAVVFVFVCTVRADITCSPTTPVADQSRTGVKHRSTGLQSASLQTVSVEDILNWPNPSKIVKTSNTPIDPREKQAYTVEGDLWRVKVEDNDCDFHLEIASSGGSPDAERVIVEIPQGPNFQQARNSLLKALVAAGEGDLSHKKLIDLQQSIPVRVSGFAFFDAFHYSVSNPKRGHGHGTAMVGTIWELHPVWAFQVLSPVVPRELAALGPAAVSTTPPGEGASPRDAYDFSITQSYLKDLENGHSIQTTLKLKIGQHSSIHPLSSDCEMHSVGVPQDSTLGWPPPVIMEPPNLCEFDPDGNQTDSKDAVDGWLSVFDDLSGKTCEVTGFPRIFTEHATGEAAASNPNHVFELHPALAISCDGKSLSFADFLRIFPGMRAISPSTTASCINDRTLEVKYDTPSQQYLFREAGGRCGNFAIVEIDGVNAQWIRKIGGGHSAIARVSPDGQSIVSLKIYTLSPSTIDDWLTTISQSGVAATERKLVHGLFTYDYFSIQKSLHPKGENWATPTDWTPISFPLAFVAFGEADSAPWTEP